jgi:hypothetical protein
MLLINRDISIWLLEHWRRSGSSPQGKNLPIPLLDEASLRWSSAELVRLSYAVTFVWLAYWEPLSHLVAGSYGSYWSSAELARLSCAATFVWLAYWELLSHLAAGSYDHAGVFAVFRLNCGASWSLSR